MSGAVLLTRPEADSREIEAALAPVPCLVWPLTRVEFLPAELPEAEALVFTSRHGVAGYLAAGGRAGLPAICVGPATRAAAEAAGFGPCADAGGDAARLPELAAGRGRVLYSRGADVARGADPGWAEAVVYRAVETGGPPRSVLRALAAGEVGLVTVWSPRGGRILARHPDLGALPAVAISAAAGAPYPGKVTVARRPDREAMLEAIRAHPAAMQRSLPKSIVCPNRGK